ELSKNRRHHHDPASVGNVRCDGLRHAIAADQVRVHDIQPWRGVAVSDGSDARDAGIIDEHINFLKFFDRRFHSGYHTAFFADIHLDRQRALRVHLCDTPLQGIDGTRAHYDAASILVESSCDCETDAAARSRYNGNLIYGHIREGSINHGIRKTHRS